MIVSCLVFRTAHELSHERSDERRERLKWPWERIINKDIDSEPDSDEQHFSNKEMYRKFRPKRRRDDEGRMLLQKFVLADNRIVCAANFDLCLGVKATESGRGEVELVKRRADDVMQCFNVQPNGCVTEYPCVYISEST